jgi:thioredoxin 1
METQSTTNISFAQLIQSSTPVLVDFHAEWCGPCKSMSPVIKEVAQQVKDFARVIKVDIDKAQSAAIQYNVQAVPTFILFRNGQVVWRHSGMIDKNTLLNIIRSRSGD